MNSQNISIPISGGELKAMILNKGNIDVRMPGLLVIHRWASAMERYPKRVEKIVNLGYVAVLFDMRGHGKTGGALELLSPHDHLNDCIAAYDYLKNLEIVDPDSISVYGSSYGGYLACLLSAQRNVAHMVLNVPADYPDDIFYVPNMQRSAHTDEYRKKMHLPNESMALNAVSKYSGDLLLIEAEFDEQVHPQVMKNFKNAAKDGYDYALIKGTDHSMRSPEARENQTSIITEWFKRVGN